MKAVHIIGGGDIGGAKTHVLSLIGELSKDTEVKLISLREGQFADEGRQLGLDIEVVDDRNPITMLRRVLNIIRDGGFDVVHCHGSKGNVVGTLLKGKHGLPTVTTVHSDYRKDYMGRPLKALTNGLLNRIALRRMDYYIGVSDAFTDMLIKRSFPPDKIFTIYNGLDFTPYIPSSEDEKEEYLRSLIPGYSPDDIIVGIAARLNPVKDISTLIRGFALAAKDDPRLRLVIAGDGEEREMLEALAASTEVAERITFAGWVSEMDKFLNAVDINTLTSITESFPYSVLEGIRANCATVCSRVGGMPNLIDHGVNGYIFTPGDHTELAKYISRFAADADLRETFSKRLYVKARQLFSIDAMSRTQKEIYSVIIRRAHRPRRFRDRVVLCGAYGRGNAGDDAIMEAITSDLRQVDPDIAITVISRNPKATRLACRIDTVHTFNPFKQFARLLRARLYINGGGTLIADNTSTRSIRYYLFSITAAKWLGAKVMLYGCGIGPINKPSNRRVAGRTLNRRTEIITLRDEHSAGELEQMKVSRPHISVTADPTLTLPPVSESRTDAVLNEEGIPPSGNYIALSLRSWKGYDRKKEVIAEAVNRFCGETGTVPILIPMGFPGDLRITEEFAKLLDCPCYLLRGKHSAAEVMGVISRTRLTLGMRLHSLIFSVSGGVPAVGIAYDTKVKGFIDRVDSRLCIDLDKVESEPLYNAMKIALEIPYENISEIANTLRHQCEFNVESATKLFQRDK